MHVLYPLEWLDAELLELSHFLFPRIRDERASDVRQWRSLAVGCELPSPYWFSRQRAFAFGEHPELQDEEEERQAREEEEMRRNAQRESQMKEKLRETLCHPVLRDNMAGMMSRLPALGTYSALRELSVYYPVPLDRVITFVMHHAPALEVLRLQVPDQKLIVLLSALNVACPRLRALEVFGSTRYLSEAHFSAILSGRHDNVQFLALPFVPNHISLSWFLRLLQNALPNLRRLLLRTPLRARELKQLDRAERARMTRLLGGKWNLSTGFELAPADLSGEQ